MTAASLHLSVPSTRLLPFTLSPALEDALIYSVKAQDRPHSPQAPREGRGEQAEAPCPKWESLRKHRDLTRKGLRGFSWELSCL